MRSATRCDICHERGDVERFRIPEAVALVYHGAWGKDVVDVCSACRATLRRPPGRPFQRKGFKSAGWIDHSSVGDDAELAALLTLNDALKEMKRVASFQDALALLQVAVHQASRFSVYVGRAGATPRHILARLKVHSKKGAVFLKPVIAVATKQAQKEHWEQRLIAWTVALSVTHDLQVKNRTTYDGGSWPKGEDLCVIYVAACGGSDLDPSKKARDGQRRVALLLGLKSEDHFIGKEDLREQCRYRHCLNGPNFTRYMWCDDETKRDPWFVSVREGDELKGWRLTPEGFKAAKLTFRRTTGHLLENGIALELAAGLETPTLRALAKARDMGVRCAVDMGHFTDGERDLIVVLPRAPILRGLEKALVGIERTSAEPLASEARRLAVQVSNHRLALEKREPIARSSHLTEQQQLPLLPGSEYRPPMEKA